MLIFRLNLEIANNCSQVVFKSSILLEIKNVIRCFTIAGLFYSFLMVIVRLILLFL